MIIYCDKCLKLAARTSHCQAVKDRILSLQNIGLIGDAAPLMCTCIGTFRGSKMATRDQVENKMEELRRLKRARTEAASSHSAA